MTVLPVNEWEDECVIRVPSCGHHFFRYSQSMDLGSNMRTITAERLVRTLARFARGAPRSPFTISGTELSPLSEQQEESPGTAKEPGPIGY